MTTSARQRRPRRDALANRDRILEHAERVFAEEGLDVSLHRLGEDLGMGIGTVYRHFPTRNDLLLGLYHRFQERVDEAGDALTGIEDSYERVVAFIDQTVQFSLDVPVARAVGVRVQRLFPSEVRVSPTASVVAQAVEEGKAAGTIRADVDVTDVASLAGMLADLVWVREPERSVVLPRMRALVLDALRPEGTPRPDLPATPVSMTELTRLAHRNRMQP
ncbi:TetR/AcrR family transcriptional regulator [Ruania halotolerans]|uniref:TetR/AcrR family transcriptional regulator n=1 Tax=Ruania halotolerans TaxID=2897773 RepID=UPI001E3A0A09|nr:TetR/AcrR family transcriptional regulator [Ruania halotolerans]UFU06247.1 TetR/AcrR family transcriptional regulator [Ruania halotolerans]